MSDQIKKIMGDALDHAEKVKVIDKMADYVIAMTSVSNAMQNGILLFVHDDSDGEQQALNVITVSISRPVLNRIHQKLGSPFAQKDEFSE